MSDTPFQQDVMLGEDARRVVTDIHQFFSKARLEKAAALDERGRLARELHDGVLQSLTAATLQLDAIARLIATDPSTARSRVKELELLLSEQQRDLRHWIEQLRARGSTDKASPAALLAALDKLRQRASWQGAMRVELDVSGTAFIPRELADHVYRIVQESLTNVAKHARASSARVNVRLSFDRAWISVADDGVGFPYRGRFQLIDLVRRQIGPVSVRDRVAALRGDLVLLSTASGSQLDVALPLEGG
jgi:signal transduction histidine kinase